MNELEHAAQIKRTRDALKEAGRNFGLTVYMLFAVFPILWMLLMSFKSDAEVVTTVG